MDTPLLTDAEKDVLRAALDNYYNELFDMVHGPYGLDDEAKAAPLMEMDQVASVANKLGVELE